MSITISWEWCQDNEVLFAKHFLPYVSLFAYCTFQLFVWKIVYFEFVLLPGERMRALSHRGVHVDDRTESSSFLYLQIQIWFDLIEYQSNMLRLWVYKNNYRYYQFIAPLIFVNYSHMKNTVCSSLFYCKTQGERTIW